MHTYHSARAQGSEFIWIEYQPIYTYRWALCMCV